MHWESSKPLLNPEENCPLYRYVENVIQFDSFFITFISKKTWTFKKDDMTVKICIPKYLHLSANIPYIGRLWMWDQGPVILSKFWKEKTSKLLNPLQFNFFFTFKFWNRSLVRNRSDGRVIWLFVVIFKPRKTEAFSMFSLW